MLSNFFMLNNSCFEGNFAERPLPSSGLVPFLRSYMCELNFSCSHQPRNSFYDNNILELTNLTHNVLKFANQPDVVSSVATLIQFVQVIGKQREEAAAVTANLTLLELIKSNETQFRQYLVTLGVAPAPLDDSLFAMIMGSKPNFNYLYSNYSENYTEPVNKWMHFGIDQNLINLLYGPDLDVSLFIKVFE
jgi:hypothetical protein